MSTLRERAAAMMPNTDEPSLVTVRELDEERRAAGLVEDLVVAEAEVHVAGRRRPGRDLPSPEGK